MAISRMQLPRELYESGGITSLQDPRQGYFLGKLVKKITKPIKKIVKSPLGKAALAGAALYGLGGAKFLGGSGIFSGGQGMSRFGNLMNLFRPAATNISGKDGILSSLFYNPEGKFSLGRAALTGLGTAGIVAPFLMGDGEDEEEEVVEQLDPNAIRQRAMQMYQQSYSPEESGLFFMPGREFVQRNFYAAGGGLADVPGYGTPPGTNKFNYPSGGETVRVKKQEGGIMDLGGQEKDFRNTGGFVDLGREERADDVPARLSKNEFVFTAEAVRNAGGGDIDKGAEVMQNMMDNLEAGGMISEESQGMNPAQEMFEQAQMMESRIA
jgi:hypothetical protein